jgi:predicted dehydrogenase
VSSGLGNTEEALGNEELATVLRRALRPSGAPDRGSRPIGLAVVGYGAYGGMGYLHGAAAQATPGLELVAACDESAERRKAAEAEFPGVRAYPTVAELVRDDDVEVVVVATPPVSHTSITLELLRAGKHVACEKPLCLTVADADEMMATAQAHDLSLTVNQSRRWDTDFVAIRRAVGAGLLGELFNVETFVGGFEHPCRAWHSEASVSGGTVFDWGSHHLDWVLLLMEDMPGIVQARGHKRVWHDVTNLDQLRVRLGWSDGREAEFVDSSVAAIRRPKFYLQGTAGTLAGWYRPLTFERLEPGTGYVAEPAHHAEAPAELTLARYESGTGLSETRLPLAAPQPFAFHRNLADHLALGEPLAVTADSIRKVVVLLEAAHRSSEHDGAPVEVAPG